MEEEIEDNFEDLNFGDEEGEGENVTPEKPRSSEKGKKKAPRKILYILCAIKDGELIGRRFLCQIAMEHAGKNIFGNDFDRKEGEAEVREAFRKTFGVEAQFLEGPFYIVRDPGKPVKRHTISIKEATKYGFSEEMISATFENWEVKANVSGNPDIVYISEVVKYIGPLTKDGKLPKKPAAGKWIYRNILKNEEPYIPQN